jgi:glycosyltransferase involved in cell wall biosynthesis
MVTRGILMARKDWILLLDGDGQIEPTDIHLLLDCPTDYDIITAIKFPRCDPIFRILTSRLFDVWSDLLLGISVHDINFGLKLMRTSMAHKLVPQCGRLGEIFTAELVIRFVYAGCRLHQVQTRHRRRLTGKSTGIPPPRLLGRSLYTLIGLFSLRRELITRQFVQPPPEER